MKATEKTTLIVLDLIFIAVALAASFLGRLPPLPDSLFLLALGTAAFRGGRAIAYNYIFKWLRDMLGVVEAGDSSGAGKSNHATGSGPKRVFGELVCCPICSATWVGAVLLLLYAVLPAFGTALIYALAAAGIAELFEWISEYFSWRGRAAREEAGTQWMSKNQPETLYYLEEKSKPGVHQHDKV